MINPKAMHANASEIIQVQSEDAIIRLIHGKFNHKVSSYQMVTDITLLHVFLHPEKSLQLPSQEMAFLYGLKGTGITDQQIINQQRLINYDTEGNTIEVTAGKEGLEFMFGTGIPLKENITYGGPFVMTTAAQMQETRKRYAEGNMGYLDTYSTK